MLDTHETVPISRSSSLPRAPTLPHARAALRVAVAFALAGCASGAQQTLPNSERSRAPSPVDESSYGEADEHAKDQRGPRDPAAPSSVKSSSSAEHDFERARLPNPLSFLIITVDTLRPDLGFMGYDRATSPQLDRWAARAVVYDHAYSISTYTGFCLPPMMASRYPSEMPRTDRHEVKYLRSNTLLAERMRAAGYHTAGAASHFLFAPELGWIDGFERFMHVPGEGDGPPGSPIDRLHSSRGLADAAIRMLADPSVTSGRFLMWIHFLDPHKKYLEHPSFSNFGDDPRGLYDGEVAFTDFHIGRVLDALAASPLAVHTAVVFTADHGEAFGEHGERFHGSEVWDEIVRVPLAVFVPGVGARRIHRRVSAVEIAPTILDLAGLPPDPGARGQSFAAELFGGEVAARPILVDQPHNPYYVTRRAFIDQNYKLHHYPESQTYLLFDLAHDPGELHNLAAADPGLLQRLQASYASFMQTVPQVTPRRMAPVTP